MAGNTITERFVALRQRPSPKTIVLAAAIIIQQGRLAEFIYSLFSILVHRPGPVIRTKEASVAFAVGERRVAESEEIALLEWLNGFPRAARWLDGVVLRLHSVAEVGTYTIAGEYCEGSPRLFLMSDAECIISTYYSHKKGVRHLHCIHPLSHDKFLVTTGDSLRVADVWHIRAGIPQFERRILRFFGGFTAAAKVGNQTYLGSDYSSRPNYLWRLEDRRTFFLPENCFRMFVDRMEAIEDRFILVICKTLDAAGGGRKAAVFDTRIQSFVEPYS